MDCREVPRRRIAAPLGIGTSSVVETRSGRILSMGNRFLGEGGRMARETSTTILSADQFKRMRLSAAAVVVAGSLFAFFTARATAQDANSGGTETVVKVDAEESFFHWMVRSSGPIGVIILLLSFYLVALVVWMSFEYRRKVAMPENLRATFPISCDGKVTPKRINASRPTDLSSPASWPPGCASSRPVWLPPSRDGDDQRRHDHGHGTQDDLSLDRRHPRTDDRLGRHCLRHDLEFPGDGDRRSVAAGEPTGGGDFDGGFSPRSKASRYRSRRLLSTPFSATGSAGFRSKSPSPPNLFWNNSVPACGRRTRWSSRTRLKPLEPPLRPPRRSKSMAHPWKRRRADSAGVNLTPLLDVVLQLITFFMMLIHFGSRIEGPSRWARLPVAPAALANGDLGFDRLVATIDSRGAIRDGDRALAGLAAETWWTNKPARVAKAGASSPENRRSSFETTPNCPRR